MAINPDLKIILFDKTGIKIYCERDFYANVYRVDIDSYLNKIFQATNDEILNALKEVYPERFL